MFNPEFLTTDSSDGHAGNSLIQYLQEQSPDTLQRVAKSASNDIQDIIRINNCPFTFSFFNWNIFTM